VKSAICELKLFQSHRVWINSMCNLTSNIGPVVFPMPPADGPMESSGVVIGASGFGFVPPGGSSAST
jgi:hypothetical protein